MSPALLRTDEMIAGYTIRERIGTGGYGEVWKADAPGGISKALKFVYGCLDDERAGCELKALTRIKEVRHPFLLSLERIEVVDGQLVIVTELADMCLKDRFKQCQAAGLPGIEREELLGYLRDVSDALDYMNERYSLQHLDIKPENLLLVGNHVKVGDFGLVKEIEDRTVSLLGGLTPVYASPESFMGKPSRQSDQYSLAIVYQEMLTGLLPFPGKTAGQLTSQHLHAKPRLTPLPPCDRAVIARALSKDPRDRFPSCRTLAEMLVNAGRTADAAQLRMPTEEAARAATLQETAPMAPEEAPYPLPPTEEEGPASADRTLILGDLPDIRPAAARGGAMPAAGRSPSATPAPAYPARPKSDYGGAPAGRPTPPPASRPTPPPTARPTPPPARVLTPLAKPSSDSPIVDLPPVDFKDAVRFRPTLFVGVGGTAARVLRRLRRHLYDRFGGLSSLPAVEMLLLETDQSVIASVTKGGEDVALQPNQVLPLLLRQPQEYREDSERFLRWLSRRWLYNIPRSLQTEGIRPLGRVAFVDHASKILAQVRTKLKAITHPDAVAQSMTTFGTEESEAVPRVYVISSIGGGTGGGMVLDVAYAIRKILGDLGISADGLCGLLAHGTSRNPASKELALANAYACLSELQHYGRSGYPADPECGLPCVEDETGAFRDTYLIHLGDDLTDERYEAAIDNLTEYLYLDAATAAGRFFEQCRGTSTSTIGPTASDVSLRTFGLSQVGYVQSNLPDLATEYLCRSIVQRWGGNAQWQEAKFAETAGEIPRLTHAEAAAHLSLEYLQKEVHRILACEMGGNPMACFRRELQRAASAEGKSDVEELPVESIIRYVTELLGDRSAVEEGGSPVPGRLHAVLAAHLKEMASWHGTELFDWIYGMVDHADVRLEGAHLASVWVADRLRAIEADGDAKVKESLLRLARLEKELAETEAAARARGKGWLRFGLGAKRTVSFEERWGDYLCLRLELIMYRAIDAMSRSIRAQVAALTDQLADLRRKVLLLAEQFQVDPIWAAPHVAAGEFSLVDAPTDPFHAVIQTLRRRIPTLASQLDVQLRTTDGRELAGLQEILHNEADVRIRLPARVRAAARVAVFGALQGIDLAEIFFSTNRTATMLRSWLNSAVPSLAHCGGGQRLLLVCPRGCGQGRLDQLVREGTGRTPSCVFDSDVNMVLCYEVQDVSLARVAEMMVEENPECASLAGRLHTRLDVPWSVMLSENVPC